MRDTVVTENGKVVTGDSVLSSSSGTPTQFYQFPYDYNFADVKRHRPLRLKRKLYEFYTAPITKFWAHSVTTKTRILRKTTRRDDRRKRSSFVSTLDSRLSTRNNYS